MRQLKERQEKKMGFHKERITGIVKRKLINTDYLKGRQEEAIVLEADDGVTYRVIHFVPPADPGKENCDDIAEQTMAPFLGKRVEIRGCTDYEWPTSHLLIDRPGDVTRLKSKQRKVAIFDFGRVLFKVNAEEVYRKMFQADGKSEADLQYFLKEIFTHDDRSAANNRLSSKEITQPLAKQHPEWAKYIESFNGDRDFLKFILGKMEGMEDTLKELKQNGYEIYGLTNWSGDTFDALDKEYPEITSLFNKIVVSGKVGVKKPDPKIYQLAHAAFGNPEPENVYFFDDKPGNTEAANKTVGWNGVPFKDVNTVRKILALK